MANPPQGVSELCKADERSRTRDDPKGFIALIFAIVDDNTRTKNALLLLAFLFTGCCVVAYTSLAETKGVHALTRHLLLPGGVFGGGWLTYAAVCVARWFRSRRHPAEKAEAPTSTEPSPEPSHKPVLQEAIPRQGRRPRRPPASPQGPPSSLRSRPPSRVPRTPRSTRTGADGELRGWRAS
jgi:hypothetical protein